MSRPVCAPLGNEAERLRGAIDKPPNSKSTDPHTLDAEDGKGSGCGQRSPGRSPVRHCDNETLRPISRSGQRTSDELCQLRSRARRNWLRRVVSGLRPGLARVLAAIPWMRIPKKMQAPMIGVARRTSSPNAVATHPRLRAIPLPRPCRG
jgi:hypothetical protein